MVMATYDQAHYVLTSPQETPVPLDLPSYHQEVRAEKQENNLENTEIISFKGI